MNKYKPSSRNGREIPERDVIITSVQSETSSNLSDSIREQILGKDYIKAKAKKHKPSRSVSGSYKTAEGSFVFVQKPKKKSSFELVEVEVENKKNSVSQENSSFVFIQSKGSSPIEIVEQKKKTSSSLNESKKSSAKEVGIQSESFVFVEAEKSTKGDSKKSSAITTEQKPSSLKIIAETKKDSSFVVIQSKRSSLERTENNAEQSRSISEKGKKDSLVTEEERKDSSFVVIESKRTSLDAEQPRSKSKEVKKDSLVTEEERKDSSFVVIESKRTSLDAEQPRSKSKEVKKDSLVTEEEIKDSSFVVIESKRTSLDAEQPRSKSKEVRKDSLVTEEKRKSLSLTKREKSNSQKHSPIDVIENKNTSFEIDSEAKKTSYAVDNKEPTSTAHETRNSSHESKEEDNRRSLSQSSKDKGKSFRASANKSTSFEKEKYSSFVAVESEKSATEIIEASRKSSSSEVLQSNKPTKDSSTKTDPVFDEKDQQGDGDEEFSLAKQTTLSHSSKSSSRMTHQSTTSRRTNISTNSMKRKEAETQTVASQTVETSTEPNMDCLCQEWKGKCSCSECNKHQCPLYTDPGSSRSRRKNTLPKSPSFTSKTSIDNRADDSSTQTFGDKWEDSDEDETPLSTDQMSDASDGTDFFDLPYQNNEEYMELLHELEKKLIARNRERVRRTMQEFEKRSRQNQNLEQPVFDYCSKDDTNQNFRKTPKQKARNCCTCCCKCGKNRRINSDILQNEKRWEKMNLIHSVIQSMDPDVSRPRSGIKECGQSRLERGLHRSSWQMDPRSGEWIKMDAHQPLEYCTRPKISVNGDSKEIDMIKPPPKCKECSKCQKKKRM